MPRSVLVHEDFPWGDDRAPRTSVGRHGHLRVARARVYRSAPRRPAELRGTYAGLAHPAAIEHLTDLGVTAVELLPVHHFVSEPSLQQRGMVNYWGYNSLGVLRPARAPTPPRPGDQVREFKEMVRALHAAGIEVILDVVYNHTAEGGPTVRCCPSAASTTMPTTGSPTTTRRATPTTPAAATPSTRRRPFQLQLITDSLRYWVTEMGVDGFRFDLASALARSMHDVDKLSSFFDTIHQDPLISQVKLIAEPWDVGEGGYQVGEFPPLWTEWNDKFRDTVRDFWRGAGGVRDLAYRLSGSSDLYQDDGRRPFASINFVTAHDGFMPARPGHLRAQAQRGQRRGQPRRHRFVFGSWCALGGATRSRSFIDAPATLYFCIAYLIFGLVMTMAGKFPDFGALFPHWLYDTFNPNDKTNLAPYRFVHFAVIVILVIRFVPKDWPGLEWRVFDPVIVCGQQSLAVFCVGVFLSFVGHFELMLSSGSLFAQIFVSVTGIAIMTIVAYYISWSKRQDKPPPKPAITAAKAA